MADTVQQSRMGLVTVGLDPPSNSILDSLLGLPFEVVRLGEDITSRERVLVAVNQARQYDLDGLLIYVADYKPEPPLLLLALELQHLPMLVFTIYGLEGSRIPVSAMQTAVSNLKHLGLRPHHDLFGAEAKELPERLGAFANGCRAARALRHSSIGLIGLPNPGMVDTAYSPWLYRRITPDIVHLDGLALLQSYQTVDMDRIQATAEAIIARVSETHIPREQVDGAARTYLAMRALIEQHSLKGMAIREWPELGTYDISMHVGAALLNDEGIVCLSEADLSAVVTALMLQYLGLAPAYLGEARKIDTASNTILLSHAGAGPLSLLAEEPALLHDEISIEAFHGRRAGASLGGTLKPGAVTVAKLIGSPLNDQLEMAVLPGEALPLDFTPFGGRTFARIRFEAPIRHALDVWLSRGFEHHMLIVYGRPSASLYCLAQVLDIEVATIM